jgi:hypothetical protein
MTVQGATPCAEKLYETRPEKIGSTKGGSLPRIKAGWD